MVVLSLSLFISLTNLVPGIRFSSYVPLSFDVDTGYICYSLEETQSFRMLPTRDCHSRERFIEQLLKTNFDVSNIAVKMTKITYNLG